MYKFEKLTVWQESLKLIEISYTTARTLPRVERNGLSDQLRRASTSVSLNIAEGSGSSSDTEFLRFLLIARKSLFEVIAILKIIEKMYNRNLLDAYSHCETVGKLLSGLIKKLKAKG